MFFNPNPTSVAHKLFANKTVLADYLQLPAGEGGKLLAEESTVVAERLFPALGETLMERVQAIDEASSDTTDEEKELLKLCRLVAAPFMAVRALPLLTAAINDTGLMVKEAGENSRGAYQWETREVTEAYLGRGYAALERLLRFLRDNKEDFPEFAAAPDEQADQFQIIRDGSDLARCLSVVQPHRTFMLLRALFETVADLYIKPRMGDEAYNALNEAILNDALTDDTKALLKLLRPATARAAMALAAGGEFAIQFGAGGFTVIDKAPEGADAVRKSAAPTQLDRFITSMERTSDDYFSKAVAYLNKTASATVFPEYFASEMYTAPSSAGSDSSGNAPWETTSKNSFRM